MSQVQLLGVIVVSLALARPVDAAPTQNRFPIGIYNVGDPAILEELHRNGFDTIYAFGPSVTHFDELAHETKRLGMRMVMPPNQFFGGKSDITKSWPVEAWYLEDEPEVNGMSKSQLEARSRKVRRWDPDRPQTFVIGQADVAPTYAHVGDILMLDWYPVPHLRLESVAEQIDEVRSHIPDEKPLWMVIQAFDWREEPQRDQTKPRIGRYPHSKEIRFMSYLAIVHGAQGLFYFRLQKPDRKTLLDYPELWQAVTAVSREIKTLQPILERGKPIPLPFSPDPDELEGKAWRYKGRDYVVILNRTKDRLQRFPINLLDKYSWRPILAKRRDPKELLLKRKDSWYLRPYQVLVLESARR